MPRTQEQLARLLEREGVVGERVVEAFRRVDRRDFVPGQLRRRAYEDRPVPLPES